MSESRQIRRLSQAIQELACGRPNDNSDLGRCLKRLAKSIEQIILHIERIHWNQDGHPSDLLVAFLGRGLLEASVTALVGRIDPFRLLVVRMNQSTAYDPSIKNESAIQWTGDVLAKDAPAKDLWSIPYSKMTRALLADYYDQLFWQPAFNSLLDKVPDGRGGEWMADLRLQDAARFVPRIRTECTALYKRCSKGVHIESVVDADQESPTETRVIINDSLKATATLGLVVCGIEHVPYQLSTDEAIDAYEAVQEVLARQESQ